MHSVPFVVVLIGIIGVVADPHGTSYGTPILARLVYSSEKYTPCRTVCDSFAMPLVPVVEKWNHIVEKCKVDEPVVDYKKEIAELVDLTRRTLTSMSEIATDEDCTVGATITWKLQQEITEAARIWAEFANAQTGSNGIGGYGRRFKRQAADGKKALNDVGNTLANSNNKIAGDKSKLSSGSQNRINKKHKDAVNKCMADSCKSASKILANTDDAERQR